MEKAGVRGRLDRRAKKGSKGGGVAEGRHYLVGTTSGMGKGQGRWGKGTVVWREKKQKGRM